MPPLSSLQSRLAVIEQSGVFSNFGPQHEEFRNRLAEKLGTSAARVQLASSATLAICGAVAVLGGQRWLCPAFTFPATAHGALHAGVTLEFGDIHNSDWSLDVPQSSAALGEFDGYLVVAPFGAPVPSSVTGRLAGRRVVVDAAASLGSHLMRAPLELGNEMAVVFSLHATKVLGVAEGAVVVFGSDEVSADYRSWSNFGFAGARISQRRGLNAKMSEVVAALGLTALDHWNEELDEWSAARQSTLQIGDELGVQTFLADQPLVTPYWIALLRSRLDRDAIQTDLRRVGIETRLWWSDGCHRMPAFKDLKSADLAVTEDVCARYLGLPMFRRMESRSLKRLREALRTSLIAIGHRSERPNC